MFVGPARTGPLDASGPLLTSPSEFERMYGGAEPLLLGPSRTPTPNVLAFAVRAFFLNGGTRLRVVRIAAADARVASGADDPVVADPVTGTAVAWFAARHAGASLEGCTVEVAVRSEPATRDMLDVAPDGTLARIQSRDGSHCGLWLKRRDRWTEGPTSSTAQTSRPTDPVADFDRAQLRAELLAVDLAASVGRRAVLRLGGLTLAPGHPRYIGYAMSRQPSRQTAATDSPVVLDFASDAGIDPDRLLLGLVGDAALRPGAAAARRFQLRGGSDGSPPDAKDYARGLAIAEGIPDVTLVAAPGYSAMVPEAAYGEATRAILAHVERPRTFRYAVLELPPDIPPEAAARMTRDIGSANASFYYPWLTFEATPKGPDRSAPELVRISPAGHLCGKLARVDAARPAVSGPGDDVVFAVEALEFEPDADAQRALTEARINCLVHGDGGTARIRQAIGAGSDPVWQREALRRYALHLERAIFLGLQWAAGEPDGEPLRRAMRETVEDFLFSEWARGAFAGSQPDEAYFVRFEDSAAGETAGSSSRLPGLTVGFAPARPGEFVTFRIGPLR